PVLNSSRRAINDFSPRLTPRSKRNSRPDLCEADVIAPIDPRVFVQISDFSSSPWMRGAPHSGLSTLIRRISARRSALICVWLGERQAVDLGANARRDRRDVDGFVAHGVTSRVRGIQNIYEFSGTAPHRAYPAD